MFNNPILNIKNASWKALVAKFFLKNWSFQSKPLLSTVKFENIYRLDNILTVIVIGWVNGL